MTAVGPGDWVICISDKAPDGCGIECPDPVVGRVYCIEFIVPGELFCDGMDGWFLVGVHHVDEWGQRIGFWPEQFAPLGGGLLSAPVKARELEDA